MALGYQLDLRVTRDWPPLHLLGRPGGCEERANRRVGEVVLFRDPLDPLATEAILPDEVRRYGGAPQALRPCSVARPITQELRPDLRFPALTLIVTGSYTLLRPGTRVGAVPT